MKNKKIYISLGVVLIFIVFIAVYFMSLSNKVTSSLFIKHEDKKIFIGMKKSEVDKMNNGENQGSQNTNGYEVVLYSGNMLVTYKDDLVVGIYIMSDNTDTLIVDWKLDDKIGYGSSIADIKEHYGLGEDFVSKFDLQNAIKLYANKDKVSEANQSGKDDVIYFDMIDNKVYGIGIFTQDAAMTMVDGDF